MNDSFKKSKVQPLRTKIKAFKSLNSAVFNNSATPTYKVNITKIEIKRAAATQLTKKFFKPSRLHIAVAF